MAPSRILLGFMTPLLVMCLLPGYVRAEMRTAVFAGGCFWYMEQPFDSLMGVSQVLPGYAGGNVENPTYGQVSDGGTGHREAVQVTYDPAAITYEQLLYVFWRNIDPFDAEGQICDYGDQYRSAIFTATGEDREIAEKSLEEVRARFGREVATQILPGATFYVAEEGHQHYYRKNPVRYRFYRGRCGRDAKLRSIWGREAGGQLPQKN